MTPVDHAIIGGMSGTLEVILMQPTVGFKNAIQEGRPIPKNPLHLYRGVLVRQTHLTIERAFGMRTCVHECERVYLDAVCIYGDRKSVV